MVAVLPPPGPPMFTKSPLSSAPRSPDPCSIEETASRALQSKSVTVERMDQNLYRTYRLQTPGDHYYKLRCRPSSRIRLLRHEADRLKKEATTLQALSGQSGILIPRLIEYVPSTTPLESPYLIAGPFRGTPLADVESQVSDQALENIERSVGRYMRQLSYVCGPAFGDVKETRVSSSSWAKCFGAMLENVLRDAEDALISLPYDYIRDQVQQRWHVLDRISKPKLVLLETRCDKSVLVDPQSLTISGVMDFSTAMWGDPFISDWFYLTSAGFIDGFGKVPNRTSDERIRQYLYTVYHSLVAVVRQCYRPCEDGDEMLARKHLTSALTALMHFT